MNGLQIYEIWDQSTSKILGTELNRSYIIGVIIVAVIVYPWKTDKLMMGENTERKRSEKRSQDSTAAINYSIFNSILSCITQ